MRAYTKDENTLKKKDGEHKRMETHTINRIETQKMFGIISSTTIATKKKQNIYV